MKTVCYAKLQEHYAGDYIARKGDKILMHAKTYTRLIKKLAQKHINRAALTIGFVPPKETICIYAF